MKVDYDTEKVAEYIANSWKAHHQKNWQEVSALERSETHAFFCGSRRDTFLSQRKGAVQ